MTEFRDIEKLAEWVENLRLAGMLPDDADAHKADGLDMEHPTPRTFILRRNRDRQPGGSLREILDDLDRKREEAGKAVRPSKRVDV